MNFTKNEIKELAKAWIFISLAFAILFAGGLDGLLKFNLNVLTLFLISAFTAGIAFLIHELMHKAVAQGYGYKAEFQAFDKMLWISLLMSLFGFLIAAPGAVVIHAFHINKEKNGKISLAGPLVNIILAIIFLIPFFFIKTTGILQMFIGSGFRINAFLALFNLIPIMPIDGAKILEWSKAVYFVTLGVAFALFIVSIL